MISCVDYSKSKQVKQSLKIAQGSLNYISCLIKDYIKRTTCV